MLHLLSSLLFFQTPSPATIPIVSCPANSLSMPVALPPGTTEVTIIQLVCIPLDPTVFAIKNGLLTLNFQMVVTPIFMTAPLAGPFDSNNSLYSLPATPKKGSKIVVFRNAMPQFEDNDYKVNGTLLVFLGPNYPLKGDVITAYYQVGP